MNQKHDTLKCTFFKNEKWQKISKNQKKNQKKSFT